MSQFGWFLSSEIQDGGCITNYGITTSYDVIVPLCGLQRRQFCTNVLSWFHCHSLNVREVTRRGGGGGRCVPPPPQAHELNESPGKVGLSRSRAETSSIQHIIIVFFVRNIGGYSRTGSGCYSLNSLWTSGIWTTCEHHKLIK